MTSGVYPKNGIFTSPFHELCLGPMMVPANQRIVGQPMSLKNVPRPQVTTSAQPGDDYADGNPCDPVPGRFVGETMMRSFVDFLGYDHKTN